jgi:hypothetical protein
MYSDHLLGCAGDQKGKRSDDRDREDATTTRSGGCVRWRAALVGAALATLVLAGALPAAAVGGASAATSAARAKSICVGSRSGCFSTIQAAVNAASDGDTIMIAPGTYAGGVTIDVSVTIEGAGAHNTIISGGGPVLTIGAFDASSEPTVSLSGLTITGGVTHSSFASTLFTGQEGVIALGGGISVPPATGFAPGGTVAIANSVISGNTVAPTTAVDSGLPCPADITITCINGDLPFAQAAGGGINTFGAMTLTNTTVSNNQAGGTGVASDVGPGGITSIEGGLTLKNSTVTDNQAIASAPNGRSAETGGVAVFGGTLTVDGSRISDNNASLSTSMPSDIPGGTLAIAGGMHVGGGVSAATVSNTTVSGNSISATNTVGDANAFSGGLHTDGTFALGNDVISNNTVTVATLDGSTGNAAGDSGAGEWAGTVTNTRVFGNSVSASSIAGDAIADAGATTFAGSMTNSEISDNHVRASSPHGSAIDRGGGLVAADVITLRNTTVRGNTADANGLTGFARGGGIFDVDESPNGPMGGLLTLINSRVTGNVLSGTAAITLQGGGIFATNPVSLTNSMITGNVPDQCFGC